MNSFWVQLNQINYVEFWNLIFIENLKSSIFFKHWSSKIAYAEKREIQMKVLKHEDECFKRCIVILI